MIEKLSCPPRSVYSICIYPPTRRIIRHWHYAIITIIINVIIFIVALNSIYYSSNAPGRLEHALGSETTPLFFLMRSSA